MVHPLTTAGEQTEATTTSAGAANAASIDLGALSTKVDVFADVSGAADLFVEVSTTGEFAGEERQISTTNFSASGDDFKQFDLAHRYVRAYVTANANEVEVVSRGI